MQTFDKQIQSGDSDNGLDKPSFPRDIERVFSTELYMPDRLLNNSPESMVFPTSVLIQNAKGSPRISSLTKNTNKYCGGHVFCY